MAALCDLVRSFAECEDTLPEPGASETSSADPGGMSPVPVESHEQAAPGRRRSAFHELHLSHNGISTSAACQLLEALDAAAEKGAYPVPVTKKHKGAKQGSNRRKGLETKPLWLRVEYNRIDAEALRAHARKLKFAVLEEVRRSDASGSRHADWEPVWRSDGAGHDVGKAEDGAAADGRATGAGAGSAGRRPGQRFGQGTRGSTGSAMDVYDWRMLEAEVPAISLPFASA